MRDALVGKVLRGTGNISYYLRDCIGEGGQGWVFRANWDDPSGHVVIVKVLRPDVIATEALRRFKREAEVLRMLSTQGRPNPYIVRFYDHAVAQVPSPFGAEPLTLPFTVLEFVDGTTLEKVMADQKGHGLPAERVRRLARQICQALDIVHVQKVVHRDLKPSNILLANEAGVEVAKVTDFGLVKLVDVNLQRTAALAGASLGYAPPEQYEQGNKRVSPRTDVFSLAAVLFEMLTGRPAFPFVEGENPLIIITRILNGARPSLMKLRDSLAPELALATPIVDVLDRELAKALAADPLGRHETVMDLWHALDAPLRAATEERAPAHQASGVSPWEATSRNAEGMAPNVGSRQNMKAVHAPAQVRPTPLPPSAGRVSEAHASNPAAWTFTVVSFPTGTNLRAAAFLPSGEAAIAIASTGKSGILRWERGWSPIPVPPNLSLDAVRGIRATADGGALVFGEGGLVSRLTGAGAAFPWRVPDSEITFHGALVEADGNTTLVGERPYRGPASRSVATNTAGVVAQFSGDRLTMMGDAVNATALRAVTRLMNGTLVGSGDWGALVRVELGVVEHLGSICGGHLLSIAPMADGGAVTVGAGGHALHLTARLESQLEAVQTTKDIVCVTSGDEGFAWAGSAQARLLRRTTAGWIRMTGELGISSKIIAVFATPRLVRAIGDDGAVIEGHLA